MWYLSGDPWHLQLTCCYGRSQFYMGAHADVIPGPGQGSCDWTLKFTFFCVCWSHQKLYLDLLQSEQSPIHLQSALTILSLIPVLLMYKYHSTWVNYQYKGIWHQIFKVLLELLLEGCNWECPCRNELFGLYLAHKDIGIVKTNQSPQNFVMSKLCHSFCSCFCKI